MPENTNQKWEVYEESNLVYGKRNQASVLITIAIPTYRRHELLQKALESVIHQKNAEHISYEVIVVDNEARDEIENETYQVVRNCADKRVLYYINQENVGMMRNWNRCLKLARGQWIALLHDDDVLDENYVSRMMDYIKAYPEAKCFVPNWREIDIDGRDIPNSKKNKRNRKLTLKWKKNGAWKVSKTDNWVMNFNFYGAPTCGMMFDKASALALGGFDTSFIMCADWAFCMKFREHYNVYKMNEVLGSYRWAVNTALIMAEKHLKEVIEEKFRLLDYIYAREEKYSLIKKYIKNLNYKMVSWEYCKKYEKAKEYITMSKATGVDRIQFMAWAVFRRIYMYFREAFVIRKA